MSRSEAELMNFIDWSTAKIDDYQHNYLISSQNLYLLRYAICL